MEITFEQFIARRGLSTEAVWRYGITGDSKKLTIPVRDKNGKQLFNKYRVYEPKKYLYDKGAKATLFGTEFLEETKGCVLCEGELDAVRLDMEGIPAVSGTGGCETFKEDWISLLPTAVFICYDSDEAGIKAAKKVHWMIPGSKIIELPKETKDVTDYLQTHTKNDFLELMKKAKVIPKLEPVLSFNHFKSTAETEIGRAKEVPIDSMVKFNQQNKARCIWHDEKTASLHFYKKNNYTYCFGCGKGGDAISVYMQLHNLSFREAVARLS